MSDQRDRDWGAIAAEARDAIAAEERERPSGRRRRTVRATHTWEDLGDLIHRHTDRRPDEWAQVRWPYQVGLLAWGRFKDAISYGQSLGLAITLHPGGGILARRGHAVAEGPWGPMNRFLHRFEQLQKEWNRAG